MNLRRELAIRSMEATGPLAGDRDFLARGHIPAPVPIIPGALPAFAREPFSARALHRLFDLMVLFTIGDFPDGSDFSSYFLPDSPWYNVFYGAYGIRSHKRDGSAWGFGPDGTPRIDEILEVPFVDYNFLTAGELGCPPDRMCFEVLEHREGTQGRWQTCDAVAVVPSGLHRPHEAVDPNPEYDFVFGAPDAWLLGPTRASYEPVRMRGRLHYAVVAPKITLVWGGMCPDTAAGAQLLTQILAAMTPLYR
jgi:hypothetical protein